MSCENCLWNGRCVAIEDNNNCDFYYDYEDISEDIQDYLSFEKDLNRYKDYLDFKDEYEKYLAESGYYD